MNPLSTQAIAAGWDQDRVARLRAFLVGEHLDALIVPRWDNQHFEYVPPTNERLAYLTGFSGSWGLAVLTRKELLLFVDGRYQEQAHNQPNAAALSIHHLFENPPERWLAGAAKSGWRIGFDAEILSPDFYDRLESTCSQTGAVLVPLHRDPFHDSWTDRPEPPSGLAVVVTSQWAGQSFDSKCDHVAARIRDLGASHLLDVVPDNVAWLLNLRGSDLEYCPVVLGRLFIDTHGRVDLFADADQMAPAMSTLSHRVTLHEPRAFSKVLEERAQEARVLVLDGARSPQSARNIMEESGVRVVRRSNPITELKAIKNSAELVAMADAALRDSGVWVELLHWLEDRIGESDPRVTELEVEKQLERLRRRLPDYVHPSFRTISAADANAAYAHYAAPPDGGRTIGRKSVFLLDAGGQFRQGGTTDTTRTWCFTEPEHQVRRDATLALKGHIALARQVFPDGTLGHSLDALARMAAWDHYRDYDHGTGHGVGHFLSVHEFPQRLQKAATEAPLRKGMVITIEPGLYRDQEYGIRHEILYEIVAAEVPGWLAFRPLAFVPFNRLLIDLSLLNDAEMRWIDDYHGNVREQLATLELEANVWHWLVAHTQPLAMR
ncbi:MAG: M24 family metallopeptidase [Pseudomonadota bacterium]